MTKEEPPNPFSKKFTLKLLKRLKKEEIAPFFKIIWDLLEGEDLEVSIKREEVNLRFEFDVIEKTQFPIPEEEEGFKYEDIITNLLKLSIDYLQMERNETFYSVIQISEDELTDEIKEKLTIISSQITQNKKLINYLSNELYNPLLRFKEIYTQVNIRTFNLKEETSDTFLFFPEGLVNFIYFNPLKDKVEEIKLNFTKKQLEDLKEDINSLLEDIKGYEKFLGKKNKNE